MAEPLMDTNPVEHKVVTASNDEAENSKCSGYCARLFTRIFRTEHIKTKVFVIYFIISIIVILALLSVVVHKKSDNTQPYSMLDNLDKEFLNVPCQVVNQAQYPPVRKESDDMCFYTKENITNILNATRKSTYKLPCLCNHTTA